MMATAPKPPRMKATSLRMTAAMAENYVSAYSTIYGPRGAARWVEEALGQLLKHPSFVTKIGAGEVSQEFEASRYIGLTPLSQAHLEDAIRRYRRVDLLVEGLPSMILRAAIRLRLDTEQIKPSQAMVAPQAEISPGKLRRRKQV
jgi:hypothetical protein